MKTTNNNVVYNGARLQDLSDQLMEERRMLRSGTIRLSRAKALHENARDIIAIEALNVQVMSQVLQREKNRIRIAEIVHKHNLNMHEENKLLCPSIHYNK